MKHELPKLNIEYDDLEPYIDKETMEVHYTKHHQAYVDKLNAALEGHEDLKNIKISDLLRDLNKIPEDIRNAIKNNGGGHWNHSFFWLLLKKNGADPVGEISEAIKNKFRTFDNFKEEFTNAALTRFGSGWAWLVMNNGELEIMGTANQDCPLSEGKIPILTLDVWEHSYYIKYLWNRAEYIKNWWKVVNWEKINENYKKAIKYFDKEGISKKLRI
ncbi:superoxide dismutase [archaeon]|nr:superoxide dismutase [archaeon]